MPCRRAGGFTSRLSGSRGDVIDEGGHFRDAYSLAFGDWALVRPDGYVGAIVASDNVEVLENYLRKVGLGAESHVHVVDDGRSYRGPYPPAQDELLGRRERTDRDVVPVRISE